MSVPVIASLGLEVVAAESWNITAFPAAARFHRRIKMTFWHWLRSMKGMEHGHPQEHILAAINDLPDKGVLFPTGDPKSFEEVKDALMVRGFTTEQIKSARGLWTQYRRRNTQP